jgi:hypothetical protein
LNHATEIILRWYLELQQAPPELVDDIVATLYEGSLEEENSTAELQANLLALAKVTAEASEEPWRSIIDIAFSLHEEIGSVDKKLHNANLVLEIARAIENVPDNVIAKRITLLKVKECVAKLRD